MSAWSSAAFDDWGSRKWLRCCRPPGHGVGSQPAPPSISRGTGIIEDRHDDGYEGPLLRPAIAMHTGSARQERRRPGSGPGKAEQGHSVDRPLDMKRVFPRAMKSGMSKPDARWNFNRKLLLLRAMIPRMTAREWFAQPDGTACVSVLLEADG